MGKKRKEWKITCRIGMFFVVLVVIFIIIFLSCTFAGSKELSMSADNYYEIYTADDYRKFWEIVENTDSSANGRLMNDICLNHLADYDNWKDNPPANQSGKVKNFFGDFDGNGQVIFGLYSENGYGLVKRNYGMIHDVTIKNSLIIGEEKTSGICQVNYLNISRCIFMGELWSCTKEDSEEEQEQDGYIKKMKTERTESQNECYAAGICVENRNRIELCGYKGVMTIEEKWYRKGDLAGICTRNRSYGEIEDCYNLVPKVDAGIWNAMAIADAGERNCYMIENSGWKVSEDSQVKALDAKKASYFLAYMNSNLYTLYMLEKDAGGWLTQLVAAQEKRVEEQTPEDVQLLLERKVLDDNGGTAEGSLLLMVQKKENMIKAAFGDTLFQDFIYRTLFDRNMDFSDLTLEEMEEGTKDVLFDILAEWNGEKLRFAAYSMEEEAGRDNNADFDYQALWQYCGSMLGEADIQSWQHNTWGMIRDEENDRQEGIVILYTASSGNQGFFFQTDENLYRIEMENPVSETEFSDIKEKIEKRKVELEEAGQEESSSKEEGAEGESKQPLQDFEAWEDIFWMLWDDRIPGDTFLWKDDVVKGGVYNALTGNGLYYEGEVFSREEILGLESLNISSNLETISLEDLICFKTIRSLSIKDAKIKNLEYLSQLTQLEELSLDHCDLDDISAIAHCTGLKKLSLQKNRIDNIESLSSLQNLTELNLKSNRIENLLPLSRLTNLETLCLVDNQIQNISPLKEITGLQVLELNQNAIQDISALRNMTKIQKLGLGSNQIKDFTPIMGMENLFSLSVEQNPSQDIGALALSVPSLWIGTADNRGDREEAQRLIRQFYKGQQIQAQDMVKGDLNQDGIEDVAIIGYYYAAWDDEGCIDRKIRELDLLLGTDDGGYLPLTGMEIKPTDMDGFSGDPYRGIAISGNLLLVQYYGDSSYFCLDTIFYTCQDGGIAEKFELSFRGWNGNEEGYEWHVYDCESAVKKRYVVTNYENEDVKKLLIQDTGQQGQSDKRYQELEEKVLAVKTEKDIELPEILSYAYNPDLDDGYYFYEIHDTLYDTKNAPKEILELAKNLYLEDAIDLPAVDYTSKEIKENYDRLAGVVLPEVCCLGFHEGTPWLLSYQKCQVMADGSYAHVLVIREPNQGNDWWTTRETICYYENTGSFETEYKSF